MKAPLPEVPPVAAKKRDFAKQAPLSLHINCAVVVLTTLLYYLLCLLNVEPFRFWNEFLGVLTALSLVLVYYLWRGYGLARGIWIWLTGLSLPFYLFPEEESSRALQILNGFDFVFYGFMLIYLNFPGIKAHFARRETVE